MNNYLILFGAAAAAIILVGVYLTRGSENDDSDGNPSDVSGPSLPDDENTISR